MVIGKYSKLVAILLVFVILASPALAMAADSASTDFAQGKKDGLRDGKADSVWYLAGCLFVFGVAAGYIVNPTIPQGKLIGKSDEYVSGYTEGYQEKSKKEQGKKALTTCCVCWGAYYVLVAAATASTVNSINDGY